MDFAKIINGPDETGAIIARDFGGSSADFLKALKSYVAGPSANAARIRRIEYARWRAMLRRCYDQHADSYKYYGGKGIGVCDRWHSFENFFEDMGPCPGNGYSIDRSNGDLGYSPDNCRWATVAQQMENRTTRMPRGSVSLINGKWRAMVRVRGKSASRYFADKGDALTWAEEKATEFNA